VILLLSVGMLAGIVAAWPPARRAARTDVLAAIAHE
jgi:ABC-type antimicrobial peptide transport system permease subunit